MKVFYTTNYLMKYLTCFRLGNSTYIKIYFLDFTI